MRELPRPDTLPSGRDSDRGCVITSDGTGTTLSLIKALKAKGWERITVLSFPPDVVNQRLRFPSDVDSIVFDRLGEMGIQKAIADIEKKSGDINLFIHLHPVFSVGSTPSEWFSDAEKAVLKQVFFLAKHLSGALNRDSGDIRNSFIVVTRLNGKMGIDPSSSFGPIAGGLYGLVKTVNIEWESVFCRAIDLDPDLDERRSMECLMAELSDPDRRLTEVGYSECGRVTVETESVEKSPSSDSTMYDIHPSSLFLVAGGAKGVTAACVRELASRFQCGFVLLGRSILLEGEPEWFSHCHDDTQLKKRCMNEFIEKGEKPTPAKIMSRLKPLLASREVRETLREISDTGSRVEYVNVDITDAEALKSQLTSITKKMGTISGIIHGAGVLADKLISQKSEGDFEAVYSTKINGLRSMLDCVDVSHLRHLVLFSSAAGFYGNEAQSDYAAANEILNKFARRFKREYPDCHVVSLNWGPWDGGMVTPELKKLFEERNVDVIPIPVGSSILAEQLSSAKKDVSQVVVGNSMIVPGKLADNLETRLFYRELTVEGNPFLNDHSIGGDRVLPIICAISWMAKACESFYPGYELFCVHDVRVLKGVIFNDAVVENYITEVQELEKSETEGLLFGVKISSANQKGNPVYHYSGKIRLLQKPIPPVRYERFDLTEREVVSGSAFYQDGTLFHGPHFQLVKRQLNYSKERLTLECEVPPLSDREQGQFPVAKMNPYADDALLQASLIWARTRYQAASLPLSVDRGEFYQPIPFGKRFFVSLEVKSSNQNSLVADVISHDEQGTVFSRLTGATVSISKNLNEKFKK